MVKIITDSTNACTCLMCRKTKSIHKLVIQYAGGDAHEITMCAECITNFALELNDEILDME